MNESFLPHCFVISLVRDIPEITSKLVTLTLFASFVHDGNMLNHTLTMCKTYFWMSLISKKKILNIL
jgi:hypothetical protein